MFFFYFYIISILLFGSFAVGPLSIRVYMTTLMAFYLMRMNKKISYGISKRFLGLYLIFLVLDALALLINGEYNEYDFNKRLLANYLNCFVSFFAIDYYIRDKEKLRQFIVVLVGVITADAIVTVLQFVGNPIGNIIAMAFTTMSEVKSSINSDATLLVGKNLPLGLFAYIFTNGMMLSVLGLLCLVPMTTSKHKILKLGSIVSLFLCFFACFATQERAALVFFLLMFAFLFWVGPFSRGRKSVLGCIVLLFVIVILPNYLYSEKLGRFSMGNERVEDLRVEIWRNCIIFLKDHLLFGGPIEFVKKTGADPHNFFLFSLIHFGLIAGTVVIYLFILMTRQAIETLLKKYSYTTKTIAGAVCVYNAISLFHNSSIATGDSIIFILFPLMLKSIVLDRAKGVSIFSNR